MWYHIRLLEKCNLNCASCYAKTRGRSQVMRLDMFNQVIAKLKETDDGGGNQSTVYLSGGEPLLHPDFSEILRITHSAFSRINILTNGLLVEKYIPELLKFGDDICVQVSLDGDEYTNDGIRGAGVYKKVINALELLDKNNIKHIISFTVSQANKNCFKAVLDAASATNSRFNNITPYTGDPDLMLDYYEWKEFKYRLGKYAEELGIGNPNSPNSCGFSYNCGAYHGGITINPDGTATGCARLNKSEVNFTNLERLLATEHGCMAYACMKMKWGNIANFDMICKME